MKDILSRHRLLALFFFGYYVFLIAYGAAARTTRTAFYAVFVIVAASVVAALYTRCRLSTPVLWGLASWGFGHMIGGIVEIGGRAIYEHSLGWGELRFDKIVHFFGFGFATLASYELLRGRVAPSAQAASLGIAAWFIGLGVGAVNETIEFLITLLPTQSNVGGFSNTGWDLVANSLGAGVAAVVAVKVDQRRQGPPEAPEGQIRSSQNRKPQSPGSA
jgi:uncharacterized membrane protein YjdF